MSNHLALILEDDPKLAELYETVLRQCHYDTHNLNSGKDAQNALRVLVPELILLDIHLPYVSGMELLKQIKEDERFKKTLLVVMTADLYTAKDLEGQVEHIILKTHGITKLRKLAMSRIKGD